MSRRLSLVDHMGCPTCAARREPSHATSQRAIPAAKQAARIGTPRPKIVAQTLRLTGAIAREGVVGLTRRKAAQAAAEIAERSAIRRFARTPWRPDGRPVFLLISHRSGGGTERHVRDLSALLESEGIRPILVRPGPGGSLVWEERAPDGEIGWCRASASDRESVRQLLDLLDPVHAHVHHLAGLPDELIEQLAECRIPYDWTIHDYHTICPRIQLIGADAVYCGEPEPAACNTCLSRLGDDQGRRVTESITVWRERFHRHLNGARRVFAPSEDVARRIARYIPGLRLAIRPHFENLKSPGTLAIRLLPGEPVRVVVLGAIVRVKGSERLLACARDARARRLPLEFHIVGSTDRNAQFAGLPNLHIAGPYRDSEVFERLAAARCHLAFLPTLCPESFMYTLSIVMAAGFYTMCYDLGAQADRVRAWGCGKTLPLDLDPPAINDAILEAAQKLAALPRCPAPPAPAVYPEPLKSYYGFSDEDLEAMRLRPSRPPNGCVANLHRSDLCRDHASRDDPFV